jgi:dUTP pyrophosphatase
VQAGAEKTARVQGALREMLQEAAIVDPTQGGFEELGAILSLPDDAFALIGPVFLDELQKSLNNTQDKLFLISAMNASGTKLEDLMDKYRQICHEIDNNLPLEVSQPKKDFIKQMLGITYNAIGEAAGIPRRIVNIPIELVSEDAKIPTYAHLGDGALDLYAPADYTINPGETVIIPCDIKVALPYGYAFLIHPRSGLSAKSKLRVANSIGLIDSQYKGNIGVILENVEAPIQDITYEFDENGRPVITSILHGKSYTISKGERFAQMRLVEVPTASFFQVESVDGMGDDRGGGFGSSGTH